MQENDSLIVRSILTRSSEIYDTQKRFGADPLMLAGDRAYFNAIAMGLLQVANASDRLSREFRAEYQGVAWERIGEWSRTINERYETLRAIDLWIMLDDLAELYGVCYVIENI
ncbi:MAG: hypothetical protein LBN32_02430 [Helicobacteraceae bacterium]|jgi:uncharacterized protein with HEPN domain|nr:hypothetical protein [Helicobacteraceae bacterium]